MRAPWKSQLTILLAGLTVILAGCLVSGTKVFEYDVVRNGNMGRPIDVFAAPIEAIAVDLESNDTFEAHKGDIKHIDRLGFSASIDNSGGSATTLRLYFDTLSEDNPIDLANAIVLLDAVTLPAGSIAEIQYGDSETALQNFPVFQDAVAAGNFRLMLASGTDVGATITDMLLIVTFTVGL
jgi:hypothetical protein